MINNESFLYQEPAKEKKEEPLEKAAIYLFGYLKDIGQAEKWNKMLGYIEPDFFDSRGKTRDAKAAYRKERQALIEEVKQNMDPDKAKRQIKEMMNNFEEIVNSHEPDSFFRPTDKKDSMQNFKNLLESNDVKLDEFSVSMIWKNVADLYIEKGMPELGNAISEAANQWFEQAA